MTLLPNTVPLLLAVSREGREIPVGFAISRAAARELRMVRDTFLHAAEEVAFTHAGVDKRQDDYLRGRYVAKLALRQLSPGLGATSVLVDMGVFGQPVVVAPSASNLRVSIAHGGGWAVAVAFDERHPMGVDLEVPDAANAAVIERECTSRERQELRSAGFQEPFALTMLWTIKEALGKCLGTGLMTPLGLYAVSKADRVGGAVACDHENFAQYHTICIPVRGFVVAVTLPRKSALQLDMLIPILAQL